MVEKHTDYNLGEIDIVTIMERIPHRYPMLMVDKMAEIRPYESAVAIKNVTASEPHFQGHFPRKPVMPYVLIIESMAQTAAVMVVSSLGKESEGKLVYFMSVDNAKFRHPVVLRIKCLSMCIKFSNAGPYGVFWRGKSRMISVSHKQIFLQ